MRRGGEQKLNFGAIFRAKTGTTGGGRVSRNPQLDTISFMDVPSSGTGIFMSERVRRVKPSRPKESCKDT